MPVPDRHAHARMTKREVFMLVVCHGSGIGLLIGGCVLLGVTQTWEAAVLAVVGLAFCGVSIGVLAVAAVDDTRG